MSEIYITNRRNEKENINTEPTDTNKIREYYKQFTRPKPDKDNI